MPINNNPKIYCLRYSGMDHGCDPKKCTAMKLNKLNLITLIKKIDGKRKNSIILDPFAKHQIEIEDRNIILKNGLIVIDCSWNKLLVLKQRDWKYTRRLPPLIAANPINYGKWEKLSSAEAIAATLFITGFKEFSYLILSKFSWGPEFFKINKL